MTVGGPVALITGIHGQDGSYLAEELVRRDWDVYGVIQPGTAFDFPLAGHERISLFEWDLSADIAESRIISSVRPDFVFHLAGISSVWESWRDPVRTTQVNALATAAVLQACIDLQETSGKPVRVVNASSAEIFARTKEYPQSELTALAPSSPYGATKAFSHMLVQSFREKGLAASNAILYNHESPRRPAKFVTRKISMAAAQISLGQLDILRLGNGESRRDWGWAPDYVECLTRIALAPDPDDFVVATGVSHSVRDFARAAFAAVGIGEWERYVEFDKQLERPGDSVNLVGDAAKARSQLGWKNTKNFDEIVRAMVEFDLEKCSVSG